MRLNFTVVPNMNLPMVVASLKQLKAGNLLLLDLINEHQIELIKQLHLHGAILFRGFACQDADYFSKAVEQSGLGTRCHAKEYDFPRTYFPNDICTSTDLPSHIPLPLHHEKPRSKKPPNHIYFCCVTPAKKGGGTIFANAEAVWSDTPKAIQEKIVEHGVLYKHFFHGKTMKYNLLKKMLGKHCAKSWSEYFGSERRVEIEKKLTEDDVVFEWVNHGNDLIILNKFSGALRHPMTNQMCWFNSSNYLNYYSNVIYGELEALRYHKYIASQYLILKDMLPLVCHYGNGKIFTPEEILEINRILQYHTQVLNWQKGDFMIVDNFTFMHGKQAHQGDRLLYSCMTIH